MIASNVRVTVNNNLEENGKGRFVPDLSYNIDNLHVCAVHYQHINILLSNLSTII